MTVASTVVGVLLVLLGSIWMLQGLNVLPGSFMTGQIQWAVYGAVALAVGCVLLYIGRRARRRRASSTS